MRFLLLLGAAASSAIAAFPKCPAGDNGSDNAKCNTRLIVNEIAKQLLDYYHQGEKATSFMEGVLPNPYYWFSSALMWSSIIDYNHVYENSTYNDLTVKGLIAQVGKLNDYQPLNQTRTIGNDDQCYWASAALQAAERNFPNPPTDKPQWLTLAQTVFDIQAERYSEEVDTCSGGLRWQIFKFNNGYDYKNAASNGCFFNLGARLARYTGNKTYANWAEKVWDWSEKSKLVDVKTGSVYDGAHVETNCTNITPYQFSENQALYTLGLANMFNFTNGDSKWKDRLTKMVDRGIDTFFSKGVAVEVACEPVSLCNLDQETYKGMLHQRYATAAQLAPFISKQVQPVLEKSARAALERCTSSKGPKLTCSLGWIPGEPNGNISANTFITALNAANSIFMVDSAPPAMAKANTGTNGGGGGDKPQGGKDQGKKDPPSAGNILSPIGSIWVAVGLAALVYGL